MLGPGTFQGRDLREHPIDEVVVFLVLAVQIYVDCVDLAAPIYSCIQVSTASGMSTSNSSPA